MTIGKGCYFNFNCCLLDCAPITIRDNVLFGPNVQAPARHCRLLQYCMPVEYSCSGPMCRRLPATAGSCSTACLLNIAA